MYQSLESCAIYFALASFHSFPPLSIRFHPFLWYVHRYSFIFPHVHEMRRRVPWFIHFHLFPFRFIFQHFVWAVRMAQSWVLPETFLDENSWLSEVSRKTQLKCGSLLRYMDIWIAPLFTPVYIVHDMHTYHIRIKNCQPHFFMRNTPQFHPKSWIA